MCSLARWVRISVAIVHRTTENNHSRLHVGSCVFGRLVSLPEDPWNSSGFGLLRVPSCECLDASKAVMAAALDKPTLADSRATQHLRKYARHAFPKVAPSNLGDRRKRATITETLPAICRTTVPRAEARQQFGQRWPSTSSAVRRAAATAGSRRSAPVAASPGGSPCGRTSTTARSACPRRNGAARAAGSGGNPLARNCLRQRRALQHHSQHGVHVGRVADLGKHAHGREGDAPSQLAPKSRGRACESNHHR